MSLQNVVVELLAGEDTESRSSRTMIFGLGDYGRQEIEQLNCGKPGLESSVLLLGRCKTDVDVLFLNKMQYLFMYLMKFEAENSDSMDYDQLIFVGFDDMVGLRNCDAKALTVDQVRAANIIFNAVFRIKRKYELRNVRFVSCHVGESVLIKQLEQLEMYWRTIC